MGYDSDSQQKCLSAMHKEKEMKNKTKIVFHPALHLHDLYTKHIYDAGRMQQIANTSTADDK